MYRNHDSDCFVAEGRMIAFGRTPDLSDQQFVNEWEDTCRQIGKNGGLGLSIYTGLIEPMDFDTKRELQQKTIKIMREFGMAVMFSKEKPPGM